MPTFQDASRTAVRHVQTLLCWLSQPARTSLLLLPERMGTLFVSGNGDAIIDLVRNHRRSHTNGTGHRHHGGGGGAVSAATAQPRALVPSPATDELQAATMLQLRPCLCISALHLSSSYHRRARPLNTADVALPPASCSHAMVVLPSTTTTTWSLHGNARRWQWHVSMTRVTQCYLSARSRPPDPNFSLLRRSYVSSPSTQNIVMSRLHQAQRRSITKSRAISYLRFF